MYTLKIKWFRHENGELADETTLFIAADEVHVHGIVREEAAMQAWEEGSFLDYRCDVNHDEDGPPSGKTDGRIITVRRGNQDTFYWATHAWLMGPTGQTIERLA